MEARAPIMLSVASKGAEMSTVAAESRSAGAGGFAVRSLVAVSVFVTIAVNGLANALPLFGRATGEVSARYPTLVTPAGYVFSIWGLIYIALIAYAIAQFARPLSEDRLPHALAAPLLLSAAANIGWLLLWHALEVAWTVPVMLVLLGSLIAAYLIARGRPAPTPLERWAVRAPLSLYLGWISVATIANIAAALVGVDWSGWGVPAEWWAIAVLLIAAGLATLGLVRERDVVFAGVFAWAFAGIAVATPSSEVRVTATTLAVAVIGMVMFVALRGRTD